MDNHDKPALEAPKAESTNPLNPSWRNPWVIIVAAFLLLVLVGFGSVVHRVASADGSFVAKRQVIMAPGGPGMVRGDWSLPAGGSELQGVVTAVNGDKLTIAGDGKTSTVTTTSSTQYLGASSAAVNDTVGVTGTSANGVLTATQIAVNQ